MEDWKFKATLRRNSLLLNDLSSNSLTVLNVNEMILQNSVMVTYAEL